MDITRGRALDLLQQTVNLIAILTRENVALNLYDLGFTYDELVELNIPVEREILWSDGKKWSIIHDGYGLGISDGYRVERPFVYWETESVAYDNPEWIPKMVILKFERMVRRGSFNRFK